jgi:hypothetical protein
MHGRERIFVPDRPDDHRRMVPVALDGLLRAPQPGFHERGIVAEFAAVAHGNLVDHIHTQLVGESDETLRRRIVRGADHVDVGGLHEAQVFQPVLAAGGAAHVRVFVVAAHAAQFYGLAIDAENASSGGNLPETHRRCARVRDVTALRQFHGEVVQIGRFRGPALRSVGVHGE